MVAGSGKSVGIVIQGPLFSSGPEAWTLQLVEQIRSSPLRARIYLVVAAWDTEDEAALAQLRTVVDRVVTVPLPTVGGPCNRRFQAAGSAAGIEAVREAGITYVCKCRSDISISERFLSALVEAARTPEKILVTNLVTRYEPFHLSDCMIAASVENLTAYFSAAEAYYEDAFSPEVQFCRMLVRGTGMGYPFTLFGYLRFLRDRVTLLDFTTAGLVWMKNPNFDTRRYNSWRPSLADREPGPILCRIISERMHRWISRRSDTQLHLLATALLVLDPLKKHLTRPHRFFGQSPYTLDPRIAEWERRF